jgi:hypothetical protein
MIEIRLHGIQGINESHAASAPPLPSAKKQVKGSKQQSMMKNECPNNYMFELSGAVQYNL